MPPPRGPARPRGLAPGPIPRAFAVVAAMLALAPLLAACSREDAGGRPPEAVEPPNVVLIVVDTLRRDHLGAYGYDRRPTSPAIDALAADAIRFDQAYSQAPWTTPSIGSLLTSRYPASLGISRRRSAIPLEATLLSEMMSAAGYATGAVVSHSFCSRRWNFDQGFEVFDESNVLGHMSITSDAVTDRALEFLESRDDRPFFLWVHYFDPHYSYQEHPGLEFASGEPYDGPVESGLVFRTLQRMDLGERDLEELRRIYDSEIAFTDRAIGRLLDYLRDHALYDDAVIVFVADHGEEFLDHGRLGHGRALYQELVHVPLLVKMPGTAPGVVSDVVSLVDVTPTVLDCAGIDPPADLVGRSLRAAGRGRLGDRPAFFATAVDNPARGVLDRGTKLIDPLGGRRELYDLTKDPFERENRLDAEPEVADRLERELRSWQKEIESVPITTTELELTDQERERLDALGYVR